MRLKSLSIKPVRREFVIMTLAIVFCSFLAQVFVGFLVPFQAIAREVLLSVLTLVLLLPFGYFLVALPVSNSIATGGAARKTLSKSEMHYRIVSQLTTTFVFDLLIAEDGKISLDFVSDDFYSFTRYSKKEPATLELFLSHIHPEDRGTVVDTIQMLIAKPQSSEIECRAYVADPHELRWLVILGKSEYDKEQNRVSVIYGAVRDITRQKAAEETLREREHLLSRAEKVAKIGNWKLMLETGGMVGSLGAQEICGLDKNEMSVDDAKKLALPEDRVTLDAAIADLLERGVPYSTEFKLRRQNDGKIVDLHVLAEHDRKNRIVYGVMQDITERKRAEADQLRTQNLLEISQRLAHIGSWEYDRLTQKMTWSDEMYRITNIPASVPVTREIANSFLPPDEFLRYKESINLGQRYSSDYSIRRPDGEVRIVHCEGEVVFDEPGKVVRTFGTMQDITERKEAEETLRENEKRMKESEAKYSSLIETAPEAIYIVQDGKVVFVNNHAVEMLGYSHEEIIGMTIEKIIYIDDLTEGEERYADRIKGTNMAPTDIRIVSRKGEALWVSNVGAKIEWEGKPAVLYFATDVTDLKNAERQKLKYGEYLQQAQRLESLGVLAGGIAHDFNNILTGLFGFLDLAKGESKDESVSEYLRLAMENMNRARALTQQLLTFSRGGAPVKKTVSMPPLIKETCQFTLHGSSIRGDYDIQNGLWDCNVDKNQVGQVLQNLIINSMQAMPVGGAIQIIARNTTFRMNEHATLDDGDYVAISVKDEGIGIPEEMISRVFDPFFTTKTKGHGLGLAISHSIMRQHDGAIDVKSELGKGATFTIYLPATGKSEQEDVTTVSMRHRGTGRILVMDDEQPVRELIKKMLESFGYSVKCKDSGKQTIDSFVEETGKDNPFVAVVLDLTIPGGMGGKEVAAEIRKLNREIPLFVASGYAEDAVIAHPEEYGFTASISKPFKMSELMDLLEKHLHKAK